MEIVKIIVTSLISLVILFALTKLMGNRQIAHLTMFDYIVSISIGSIAAEMATDLENPAESATAMIVYGVAAVIISVITSKSMKARRLIFGKTTVLMKDGVLYRENFKRAHFDLNEFLMQSRTAGYFELSEIKAALLESNGQISFMPYPHKRPVTAADLKTVPEQDFLHYNVIMDGVVLEKNLRAAGFDAEWLKNELELQNIKDIKKVFLAVVDESGTLDVFENTNKRQKNDFFE